MAEEEDKSATKRLRQRMKMAKTATMNQLDLARMGLLKMTSKGNLYEPTTKGTVTHEGFLFKKSPGGIPLMRHWHKRWFVLEAPGKLLYYSDRTKIDLKGIIPLDMIEKMIFRATRLTLLMESTENSPSRKFSLKGETDEEVKTWGDMINKAFEELDRLEEENEETKGDNIAGLDAKYWKVETRKKLNLSVSLPEDGSSPKLKLKKAELKIDPRAKEIEAEIAAREAAELKNADGDTAVSSVSPTGVEQAPPAASSTSPSGYVQLNDDAVAVSPPASYSSSSSPPPAEPKSDDGAQPVRQEAADLSSADGTGVPDVVTASP